MICIKEKCTACEACVCICPKSAINMEKDEYGNIYPVVDEKRCINCNMCKKVCPQLKDKLDFKKPIGTYAMYNKDIHKREQSTSGGIATILYETILSQNGVVYGVSNIFGNIDNLHFIRIENRKELDKIKNSKYVHAYTDKIFIKVKKDLIDNRKVLFIGTPCQVSGLKSFLMKDYDNLITADIICHGVTSKKLLLEQINELNFPISDIKYIIFRDKSGFTFKLIDFDGKTLYKENSELVPYYRNFLEGNTYRENCYECRYAQRQRISDITIGDFWGLNHNSKIYDDELKGISVVLPVTQKGSKIIKTILNTCQYDKRTLDEACKYNGQLNHPMKKSEKYSIYIKNYPKYGFKKTMKLMLSKKEKLKLIIKKTYLYRLYKK